MLSLPALILLAAAPSHAENWLDLRTEMETLARAGDFPAAAALGDALLTEARDRFGESSEELAQSQILLGSVYALNGEPLRSEASILEAIEIYERIEETPSARLIGPYVALGETYHVTGRYERALAAYEQARDLSRRAYGLLNEGQAEILDRMAQSALAMGDFDLASDWQYENVTIAARAHGNDSQAHLDAFFRYADWLRSVGARGAELQAYFDIDGVIDRYFDDDPRRLIRLLRTRAAARLDILAPRATRLDGRTGAGFSVYNRSTFIAMTAPFDLNRALRLLRKLDEPDPLLHAALLRDLGDWSVAFGHSRQIHRAYAAAWEMLGGVEGGEALRQEWFSDVTMVYQAPLLSPIPVAGSGDAPTGRVDLSFTIDASGRARNVRVVSADPPGLVENAAIRQIASSTFRPRMIDGEPADSRAEFSWAFPFDPETATTSAIGAAVTD